MVGLHCWTSWCVDQVVLSAIQWTWIRKGRVVEMGAIRNSDCKCFCSLHHGSACHWEESGKLLCNLELNTHSYSETFKMSNILDMRERNFSKSCTINNKSESSLHRDLYLVQANSQTFDTVAAGIQLGFLGCLSTVSTFIAEFNAMRESKNPWRAYAYASITICLSFSLGTLIYAVPVWTKGYE